jgi:glycosyltransferase involved in cell wall biosynthesis
MKKYFLINSLAGGGAEAVLVRVLPHLNPKKVFLLEKDIKYSIDNSIVYILSKHATNTNPILKTFTIPIYSYNLSRVIEKNSTIFSFLERANFVNVISKIFKNHKAVISVHSNSQKGHIGLRKLNKILIKFLYPRANLIVAVSKGVKQSLIELGIDANKIIVIYNPHPIENIEKLFQEPLEAYDSIFDYPSLITVGRLTKPKGQWYLLRIFKALKEKRKDLKLIILGEGELKNYLVELSEKLGLKTFVWDRYNISGDFDVYFLGFQKNPFRFISRSKIFVLPSLWEGFSNVLVEAMACGVPIISSDCRSGPREILAPETDFKKETKEPEFAEYGILMPTFEGKYKSAEKPLVPKEKMWVEVIEKMLKNENLRKQYSEKAKQRARDFRVEKIVEEWKGVLK